MDKLFATILIVFLFGLAAGQSISQKRAGHLGRGVNLSYLDNYWLGSKEKNFSDFAKAEEVLRREKMFAEIREAGFKSVRIPINFGAWANFEKPFAWNKQNGLEFADKFVKWAIENDLIAIIDLHHVEMDGSIPNAASTDRLIWLWNEIARRYKNTDPERVYFEIRNEPHDIAPDVWRKQAAAIIKSVRQVAPRHTLVVGFHDWNSRQALIDSMPFEDKNIIYTFHFYDPFLFTHQGATWSGEGLGEIKGVPFPYSPNIKVRVPRSAEGKWVGGLARNYKNDSDPDKMFEDLKSAKAWAVKHDVPIFLGEFGSFGKFAGIEDRCNHAKVIYDALGKLRIPNAWWEWDGGFSMFEIGTDTISRCMRDAIERFDNAGN